LVEGGIAGAKADFSNSLNAGLKGLLHPALEWGFEKSKTLARSAKGCHLDRSVMKRSSLTKISSAEWRDPEGVSSAMQIRGVLPGMRDPSCPRWKRIGEGRVRGENSLNQQSVT